MASLIACAGITITITLGIVFILLTQTIEFFNPAGHLDAQGNTSVVKPTDFFFGMEWNPLLGGEKHFGVWPLIAGTLKVAFVAMVFALPVGLISAIWLSEYAKPKVRNFIKPIIEVLAGIPTVVFGFFAVTFITPYLLRWEWWRVKIEDPDNPGQYLKDASGEFLTEPAGLFGLFDIDVYNALGAGLAVGIMCLPIVISLSEDALRAVPKALREGSYGLGASKFETSVKVVVPAALSGISAAFLLAIARAVGETMIVALAAGASPVKLIGQGNLWENITSAGALDQSVLPMTGYLVKIFTGDAAHGTVEYYSSYAVAFTLFIITLVLVILGNMIQRRFREKYD
ncbi:MAG: phosphate ABC transporter permease subunit PstC [Phycisphaeraceae bacterium]|nr:phosphate ABC transporter permease subunit PstC [Phycisphaeraceae bacterium]